MNPPENEKAWLGQSAESLYAHKEAGLDGVRCGYYLGPWTTVRAAISWSDVTCPDCLKLKEEWEPQTVVVDTRGD